MPHFGEMFEKVSAKRVDNYVGSTNAAGTLTITFNTPFMGAPFIDVSLPGADANTLFRLASITDTAVTVSVEKRASLTVLSLQVLSFGTTPVSGQQVRIRATQS